MPESLWQRIITLSPPDQAPDVQLDARCYSLIIQNPTSAWWYVPDVSTFIPPYAMNMCIPLTGGQTVSILYQSPVGIDQPATVAPGQIATFHVSTATLQPTSGVNANSEFNGGVINASGRINAASPSFSHILQKAVREIAICVQVIAYSANTLSCVSVTIFDTVSSVQWDYVIGVNGNMPGFAVGAPNFIRGLFGINSQLSIGWQSTDVANRDAIITVRY